MSADQGMVIRIAGASGSSSDRRSALADLAKNHPNDPIDVIIGDWLSEANMTKSAGRLKTTNGFAYEPSFLEALDDGQIYEIKPPSDDGRQSLTYPDQQPSQEGASPPSVRAHVPLSNISFGPLGWIAHARSGDKGSNANVGFWVRHRDEYEWLRNLLSVDTLKLLLGKEYKGKKVDRMELPHLFAVHFLLHDHLDRGVSCTKTYDVLAKNLAEYLRARHIHIPTRFLDKGNL